MSASSTFYVHRKNKVQETTNDYLLKWSSINFEQQGNLAMKQKKKRSFLRTSKEVGKFWRNRGNNEIHSRCATNENNRQTSIIRRAHTSRPRRVFVTIVIFRNAILFTLIMSTFDRQINRTVALRFTNDLAVA